MKVLLKKYTNTTGLSTPDKILSFYNKVTAY